MKFSMNKDRYEQELKKRASQSLCTLQESALYSHIPMQKQAGLVRIIVATKRRDWPRN